MRLSNIELLRIIAMFMILMLHADFWLAGIPTGEYLHDSPAGAVTRIVVEMVAIVGVNVFILISGWFGIRPTVKRFTGFLFQIAFFSIGIWGICVLLGVEKSSIKAIACNLFLLTRGHWFIKAYIALFFLAPILNAYVRQATLRQLGIFLIIFYAFQTIWGWTNSAPFVQLGYSAFSFIGLYILASYLSKRHQITPPRLQNANQLVNKPMVAYIPAYSYGQLGSLLRFDFVRQRESCRFRNSLC